MPRLNEKVVEMRRNASPRIQAFKMLFFAANHPSRLIFFVPLQFHFQVKNFENYGKK